MTRAALVLALAACNVAELDYTGKTCPCPNGYDCNLQTQTCVRPEDRPDARSQIDGSGGGIDGPASDSCLPNPRTKLLYASVGFPDFPTGWLSGNGSWTKAGGEVVQQSTANDVAWLSHSVPTTGGIPNYRIVATMRSINAPSGGLGIAFRVQQFASMYGCTFDPFASTLVMHKIQNLADSVMQMRTLMPGPTFDPAQSFTLEIDVTNGQLTCCLRGFAAAQLAQQDATFATGTPGILTLKAQGAFSSFHAYE